MRLLLDTHVFLWWRVGDRRLKKPVRIAIASADVVFVSAASAWEAAVKAVLGKLSLPGSFEGEIEASQFDKLAITVAHAELAGALPPHHRDPFDRMLVAQAVAEQLTLVSADKALAPYMAPMLWV